jgi:predicted secreted hydrolase
MGLVKRDGGTEQLASADISFTPQAYTEIAGRKIPTSWRIAIAKLAVTIDCTPLNAKSWMGTNFPYWEGPISFDGSHSGLGYLEMTGY